MSTQPKTRRSPENARCGFVAAGRGQPRAPWGFLLDELPEFSRPVLEPLRQPLEDGVVSVARVGGRALFPARFRLVATINV
jgi:hypothetical protein